MFLHIFTNRLKCLMRDFGMMFWTALFPILLATMFGLAFSNLSTQDNFIKIPIAVVDNTAYQMSPGLKPAVEGVSSEGENQMFLLTACSQEKAAQLLKDDKIKGYLLPLEGDKLRVVVKESGISQTILKSFADHYLEVSSAYREILTQNPAAIQALTDATQKEVNYFKEVSTDAKPDNTLIYYFALIAMACLYGGFQGLKEVSAVQANQTFQGARVNLAPVHKMKVFGYSLLAAVVIQVLTILLLICYLYFVIGVQFGDKLGYIILAIIAGSFMGVAFGAAVGALMKKREGFKIAVIIGLSMICSFLSGLMFPAMKYIVARNVPILSYLNPASLISDAFYALYYYDTLNRYFLNIGLLFGLSGLLFLIVYFIMRRQKYASL